MLPLFDYCNILKKSQMYSYLAKVKYLESLLTILFVHLLFFFYNDYNNKMYLILSYQVKQLQILQDTLVRSIFKIDRFYQIHISQYLNRLHWPPIQCRVIFNILLLTHNYLHHNRLEYLSSLISIPTHTISIRSTTSYLLHLPSKFNIHTTNIRAWHISAPYLWNKLPHNLRSTISTNLFKSLIKTYLFTTAFP